PQLCETWSAPPVPRHSSNCGSSASATVRALIPNTPTRRRHRSPLSANGASRQAAIPLVAHHTDRRRVPPHLFRPKQPLVAFSPWHDAVVVSSSPERAGLPRRSARFFL